MQGMISIFLIILLTLPVHAQVQLWEVEKSCNSSTRQQSHKTFYNHKDECLGTCRLMASQGLDASACILACSSSKGDSKNVINHLSDIIPAAIFLLKVF